MARGLKGCMGVEMVGGLSSEFFTGGSVFVCPVILSCLRAMACVAARTVAITACVRCRAYCLGELEGG